MLLPIAASPVTFQSASRVASQASAKEVAPTDGNKTTGLHALVFAGFLWSQVTRLPDLIEVQACGRELSNLASAARGQFHLEDLGANQAARRAFVHRKKAASHPVPSFMAVCVVDANHHPQLRLAPKAREIGRKQAHAGI